MKFREALLDLAQGNHLTWFWWVYRRRAQAKSHLGRSIFTFLLCCAARRGGGYVGPGAVFEGRPSLPHGLHGVFISRFAVIGPRCRIYQNVTIGEIDRKAPRIGADCLIGAGAVLVGGIRIGNSAKIGAGAVVSRDVPDGCTVVAPPPRILEGRDTP